MLSPARPRSGCFAYIGTCSMMNVPSGALVAVLPPISTLAPGTAASFEPRTRPFATLAAGRNRKFSIFIPDGVNVSGSKPRYVTLKNVAHADGSGIRHIPAASVFNATTPPDGPLATTSAPASGAPSIIAT